ncbi:MAG: thiol:disulfide interchange protein DsbA/DsbL [Sulfuritalea sp.]|nr:thiol:disulfide interchange protein DsbA/DsbL [Sulfuritalea sp.]
MRTWHSALAAFLTIIGVGLGCTATAAELIKGKDYQSISPPLATDSSKIEVTEFFWYGCPHCFDFEPVLGTWLKKLPPDVSFRRVPAIFPNNQWAPAANLYYSLEAMGLLEQLHGEIFKATHIERKRLSNEKILHEWLATKGVDIKKFRETSSSFGVKSRVAQARRLTLASGMTGVPSLMVNGMYLALPQSSHADMVATVEQIVENIRAISGGKPGTIGR